MSHTHDTSGRTVDVRVDGAPGDRVDLSRQTAGTTSEARVLSTAAELALMGRTVNERELVRLTGLEPEVVQTCVRALCEKDLLVPVSAAAGLYVFPDRRRAGTVRDARSVGRPA